MADAQIISGKDFAANLRSEIATDVARQFAHDDIDSDRIPPSPHQDNPFVALSEAGTFVAEIHSGEFVDSGWREASWRLRAVVEGQCSQKVSLGDLKKERSSNWFFIIGLLGKI